MKLIAFNIQISKSLTTILLATVILLSGCDESPSENSNGDAYLQQAQSYLKIYQFKSAFSAANQVIKAEPNKIDGYLLLAKINEESGRPQQNIALLEAFKGTTNSEYYFSLLNAYQVSGKITSAQNLINSQLAQLQQQPQRLQLAQAKQLFYKKEWSPAKSAFTALLNEPPYKMESMFYLARIEASTNNMNNAITLIDNILELTPLDTDALFLKSVIYLQQGDLGTSEKLLTQALSSLPTTDIFTTKRIQIMQSMINVLTQQGRSSEAMIYSRILAAEFPAAEPMGLQYTRAVELFENQQFSASKALLLEILDNAPQHKKAATLLGLIFYKEGDPKNAEKYLAEIVDPEVSPLKLTELYITTQLQQNKSDNVLTLLKSIPKEKMNTETWVLYGKVAISQNKFTEAKMALAKAKSLTPNSIKVILLENNYYNSLPEPKPEIALQLLSNALASHGESALLQNVYIRQLILLNKRKEADNYVNSLQKNDRSTTQTQLLIANYYIYKQKIDDATKIIEKILASEENNLQALYSLAKINTIGKDWESSLVHYKTIIKFYPSEISAYKALLISLLQLHKDPLTVAEYLPKNYQASLLALTLAELALRQNKLDLASEYGKEAAYELPTKYQASLDELTLQINLKKALNAFIDKDYLQARQTVLAAIQKSPQDTRLLSLLVHIEITSGQYNEAKKVTEQIRMLLPKDPLATLLNTEILLAQQQQPQAINLLDSYWQQTKDEKVAEQLYLLLRTNALDKADAFLNKWQTTFPNSLIAMRYQAIDLQSKGDIQQALQIYEKILNQTPNDVVSLNNAAWLYSQQNSPRALTLAEQAYQLAPNNGAIADTYGWILFNNGDQEQGRKLIQQALTLLPGDASIKAHFIMTNKM